ncbi:MAG: uncharacterized protein JWO53_1009 [Chlamydiia bacterium]|nr:uncharacterized protein [Chlamydiia bacterium]
MKKHSIFLALLIFILYTSLQVYSGADIESEKTFHYYCTVADERHFTALMSLIGSIHKHDFEHLDEIAIFDLGFTAEQKMQLEKIEKAKVYAIEKVHPDLFTYFQTSPEGRSVRGWFAWKPVVIKQALDMFPYILYLDAGTLVLNSPDNLFKHIKQNGYYLMEIPPHSIEGRITKPVIEKIILKLPQDQQEALLRPDTFMIDAGFQGISRVFYQNYVFPMYELAPDLTLFEDDGSSKMGFGAGRHDQTLFSIFAHVGKFRLNSQGWTELQVDGNNVPFHIHWHREYLNDQTCIYRSRDDCNFGGDKTTFIQWRK